MTDHLDNVDEENVVMLNGRSVMNALAYLNSEVTENELLKLFIGSNREPRDLVQQEIKRVLDDGVINGFIGRNGNKYGISSSMENLYQVDGDDSDEDCPKTPSKVPCETGASASGGSGESATAKVRIEASPNTKVTVKRRTNPSCLPKKKSYRR